MQTKATLIALLVAGASFVSAHDFNGGAPSARSQKRCIGACTTTNSGGSETNSNTNTNASTSTSSNVNTADSGNTHSANNNMGGQSFAGMTFAGSVGGCKRAYMEGRADNLEQHRRNVEGRPSPPRPQNRWVNNKQWTNTANSGNTINKTNNVTVDKSKSNTADQSGNGGVIVGSGNMCRREFIDLEIERRELDTGASVLAALGGLHERDADSHESFLATRDIGKMAQLLGVRGPTADGFYKRDVGLVCARRDCDEKVRREAEDLLYNHARDLGFFSEEIDEEM